jgi:hypothetical protein
MKNFAKNRHFTNVFVLTISINMADLLNTLFDVTSNAEEKTWNLRAIALSK